LACTYINARFVFGCIPNTRGSSKSGKPLIYERRLEKFESKLGALYVYINIKMIRKIKPNKEAVARVWWKTEKRKILFVIHSISDKKYFVQSITRKEATGKI